MKNICANCLELTITPVSYTHLQQAQQLITEKYGDNYEVTMVNGGQPVYYYMISVE